jgi:hypothetical protein
LPRDLSEFEIEAFFTFSEAERRVIEERRSPILKLALALQIGFLRMSGRLLEAGVDTRFQQKVALSMLRRNSADLRCRSWVLVCLSSRCGS